MAKTIVIPFARAPRTEKSGGLGLRGLPPRLLEESVKLVPPRRCESEAKRVHGSRPNATFFEFLASNRSRRMLVELTTEEASACIQKSIQPLKPLLYSLVFSLLTGLALRNLYARLLRELSDHVHKGSPFCLH